MPEKESAVKKKKKQVKGGKEPEKTPPRGEKEAKEKPWTGIRKRSRGEERVGSNLMGLSFGLRETSGGKGVIEQSGGERGDARRSFRC